MKIEVENFNNLIKFESRMNELWPAYMLEPLWEGQEERGPYQNPMHGLIATHVSPDPVEGWSAVLIYWADE